MNEFRHSVRSESFSDQLPTESLPWSDRIDSTSWSDIVLALVGTRMNRRRFLLRSLRTAGLAVLSARFIEPPHSGSGMPFRDESGIRRLGRRYLELHDEPADADWFRTRLQHSLGMDPLQLASASGRRALQHAVRRDFAQDRTVTVDGWVVTLSEAHLGALYALT